MRTIEDLAHTAATRQLPSPAQRRAIRERGRLTQADLAEVLGVQRPTVTRWELGVREPRGRRAEIYAYALRRIAEASASPETLRRPGPWKATQPAPNRGDHIGH